MVSDILEDNLTYQDFEKSLFIHKLGNAFDKFIYAGDTFLQCYKGYCSSEICNYRFNGYSFIGNNSNNYLDMILKIKDGIVEDMYECSVFKMRVKDVNKKIEFRFKHSICNYY